MGLGDALLRLLDVGGAGRLLVDGPGLEVVGCAELDGRAEVRGVLVVADAVLLVDGAAVMTRYTGTDRLAE